MEHPVTEIQPINHNAIRDLGLDMTRYLGALAEANADRRAVIIGQLNECADQIPYAELFEEDDDLTNEIIHATVDHSQLDSDLYNECVKFDDAARLIARTDPTKHKEAEAKADSKKTEAKERVAAQKAELDAPRLQLEAERAELDTTINLVGAAWPVAPYPEQIVVAPEPTAEPDIEPEEEDPDYAEDPDYTPSELQGRLDMHLLGQRGRRERQARRNQPHLVEDGPAGPYAELAASIPTLSDRLKTQVSEHAHAYDGIETAQETMLQALAQSESKRSEQEDSLLKAIYVLRNRYLEDPNDLNLLKVYTADEIIDLATQLHALREKNRPDFDGLEERILEAASVRQRMTPRRLPKSLEGAKERMEQDAPNRYGLQWASLNTYANRACDAIRNKLLAGGDNNLHLHEYVINVVDRSDTKPDLSWVFQFVADDFANSTLGSRRTTRDVQAKEHFEENCTIISEWLAEATALLDQLPKNFRLKRYDQKKGNFRFRSRRAEYDNAPAGARIRNTVKDIETRRDGTGDPKVLRLKPMRFDPVGALNHQLRLGHMVNALKAELRAYDVPTEGHTEEITPLA